MKRDELDTSANRCRIPVVISARGADHRGFVVRLSEIAMELLTDQVAEIWTGDAVRVVGGGFGPVRGTAQWRMPRRLIVRFDEMAVTDAGLRDMWRFTGASGPPRN
jgi:hypothetical protein